MLDFRAGRFKVTKDGRVAFDTDTPAARLVPSETLRLTDYSFEFPDLYKGIIWSLVNSRNSVTGTYSGAASSYIGLVGQEWGPSAPAGYTLPDIVLGVAPPAANYLNIKVKITRTVTPAKMAADLTIPEAIPVGKWTRIEGASCPIERYGALRRMIDIVLEDGQIILRRKQSVRDTAGTKERISQSVSTSNGIFFYYNPGSPGTNAGYSPGHFAEIGEWLSHRSDGSSPSRMAPGGSNAVETNTALKSYQSVWTGDIEITPGRIG
jgi:hypothetical protein